MKILKRLLTFILSISLLIPAFPGIKANAAGNTGKVTPMYTFDGHGYTVFDISMSWYDAKAYCEQLGGHLVTINSPGEQAFVAGLPSSKMNLWMGGYCEGGVWKWVTGEQFDQWFFLPSEPNGGGEGVLMMYKYNSSRKFFVNGVKSPINGYWNDHAPYGGGEDHELSSFGFVCEWGVNISLSADSLTLKIGEKKDLNVIFTPPDVADKRVTISTDNEKKIKTKINDDNTITVTGKRAGKATITVTSVAEPNASATCEVEITRNTYDEKMTCFALSNLVYNTSISGYIGRNVENFLDSGECDKKLWSGLDSTFTEWYDDVVGNWKIIDVKFNTKTGFFAAAFDSPAGNKRIIAYRGTSDMGGIATDAVFAVNNALTTQFDDAQSFYYNNNNGNILLTGHSLGGALASSVSLLTDTRAITVNGASGLIIEDTFLKHSDMLSNSFQGVDEWKFSNHVTISPSTDFNYWVAYPNKEKYNTCFYQIGRTDTTESFLTKLHSISSLLNYDTSQYKFAYTPSNAIGTTDSIKKFSINGGNIDFLLGTTGSDKLIQTYKQVYTYAFGGNGNDFLQTLWAADYLCGGNGTNTLDGGLGDDTYVITTGNDTINDPSGDDTIKIMQGTVLNIGSTTMNGVDYFILNLSNGNKVYVNKFRNRATKIKIVDSAGNFIDDLGETAQALQLLSRKTVSLSKPRLLINLSSRPVLNQSSITPGGASPVVPTVKNVHIDGTAKISIYDSNNVLLGEFDNNTTKTAYEKFGYFYMTAGENPGIEAILFNDTYKIEIAATGKINYEITDFSGRDEPLTELKAENIVLDNSTRFETQTAFTTGSSVPMVVKNINSDNTQSVSYTVNDSPKDTPPVTNRFDDLNGYDWAKDAILFLADKGIIAGTGKTTYSPGKPITRADYMVLMLRMLGLKADFSSNFDDVPKGSYYYDAVGTAKELGLATGIGNNKFNPNASISRQDLFVMAYRILQMQNVKLLPAGSLDSFSDNKEIAGYAKEAMSVLVANGLIKGSNNQLNPTGNATRAEVAVFIFKIFDLVNS